MKYSYITFLSLVFFPGIVFADLQAENNSTALLTVEVINNTANGIPVIDDEIIVQIFQHQQLISTFESNAPDDGKAIFEDVPVGEHAAAIARVKHNDMMFTSGAIELIPSESNYTIQVDVFDVTTDRSKLSIETHHLIIDASSEGDTLEITEFMELVNSSDMAISSEKKDSQGHSVVIEMMLPEGFRNLQFTDFFEEGAIVVTDNGFYDIMAIAPGSFRAAFIYTLDITSVTMDIVKRISLPTENFMVFVNGYAKLNPPEGMEKKIMNNDNISMEYLKFSNLSQEQEISFQISGLVTKKSDILTWIILAGVFGIIIVFAVIRSGNSAPKNQ